MTYVSTHINIEGLTNRQRANKLLKALNALTGANNGTIRRPEEVACWEMKDGRTVIQTVNEDGYIMLQTDMVIIIVDNYSMYVDYASSYVKQWGLTVDSYTDIESEMNEEIASIMISAIELDNVDFTSATNDAQKKVAYLLSESKTNNLDCFISILINKTNIDLSSDKVVSYLKGRYSNTLTIFDQFGQNHIELK